MPRMSLTRILRPRTTGRPPHICGSEVMRSMSSLMIGPFYKSGLVFTPSSFSSPLHPHALRIVAGFDLGGGDHGLRAAFDAELLQDRRDMRFHGRFRDRE